MQDPGRFSVRGERRCFAPQDRAVLRTARVTLGSGLSLSYAENGTESGPAVLFLPGPTDSWRSYEPVLSRLPQSLRAIAVSQRGHGDSDKPDDGYEVDDFAGDVVAFLDTLEIDRAVLVSPEFYLGEELSQIRQPTLVIWGERDMVGSEIGEASTQRLPDGRFTVIRGIGHFPFLEAPRECAAAIVDFIS
jgi:pimeloyl-ACP methyl ester carboxylesterase